MDRDFVCGSDFVTSVGMGSAVWEWVLERVLVRVGAGDRGV